MIWLILPLAGMMTGFIAGLFGVGGGTVMVPVILLVFGLAKIETAYAMQIAVATSLATIALSSSSSILAHHQRRAVDWRIIRRLTPGVVLGVIIGTLIAARVESESLQIFFALFLLVVAATMFFDIIPASPSTQAGSLKLSLNGSVIGMISAMTGIGGGAMTVPFLVHCGLEVRNAIGTAAANGFPIAFAGALAFIIAGWNNTELPQYSIGYVYWPACLLLGATSILFAPLGAKLAHTMPSKLLKRCFASFMVIVAIRLLTS